jgi:hypothetical protein
MQKSLETICLQKIENPPFVQMIQIRGPEGGVKCVMATIAPIRHAEHPIMMEYGWYSDTLLHKNEWTTNPCVNYIVLYKIHFHSDRACVDTERALALSRLPHSGRSGRHRGRNRTQCRARRTEPQWCSGPRLSYSLWARVWVWVWFWASDTAYISGQQ